jgi:hypothetical protein
MVSRCNPRAGDHQQEQRNGNQQDGLFFHTVSSTIGVSGETGVLVSRDRARLINYHSVVKLSADPDLAMIVGGRPVRKTALECKGRTPFQHDRPERLGKGLNPAGADIGDDDALGANLGQAIHDTSVKSRNRI